MQRSKRPRQSGHGEIVPPLSKLDRIGELLRIQVETFPPKELNPEEIARWEQDLGGYPLQAIDWAFDNWRRNGRFFPVPGDIIDICETWEVQVNTSNGCSGMDCKARHGKGYGENDVLYLWHEWSKKRTALNRELLPSEVEEVMAQLDKVRGGAPEWRT